MDFRLHFLWRYFWKNDASARLDQAELELFTFCSVCSNEILKSCVLLILLSSWFDVLNCCPDFSQQHDQRVSLVKAIAHFMTFLLFCQFHVPFDQEICLHFSRNHFSDAACFKRFYSLFKKKKTSWINMNFTAKLFGSLWKALPIKFL